jgi:MFS family permease
MSGVGAAARDTVETAASWRIATVSVLVMAAGWGAPSLIAVSLKPIAADLGTSRSIPALAASLTYLGSGFGGIAMGWAADRIGAMWPALLGSLMIGLGLIVAGGGGVWQLYLGFGLLVGLLGGSGLFSPLMANASRWFDRRRGTALTLVASGQPLAGAIWPPIFRWGVNHLGWQATMLWYGVFVLCVLPPLCLALRRRPPAAVAAAKVWAPGAVAPGRPAAAALPTMATLCAAIVCCCVPMAMPSGHVVALCSDLGFAPARGAEMLSLLLGGAFVSRVLWGRMADRVGGLLTILASSLAQAAILSLFAVVDGLVGLYLVSAAFGLAFGGLVPSYVLAVRDLFPAREAGWRIGTVLLFGLIGMASGAWLAGWVFDRFLDYRPAFLLGVAVNLVNLALISTLIWRRRAIVVASA